MPVSTSKDLKFILALSGGDDQEKDERTSYIFNKVKQCTLVACTVTREEVQGLDTYMQDLAPQMDQDTMSTTMKHHGGWNSDA